MSGVRLMQKLSYFALDIGRGPLHADVHEIRRLVASVVQPTGARLKVNRSHFIPMNEHDANWVRRPTAP